MNRDKRNTIVLVTCVAAKKNLRCQVKDMYLGQLFQDLMNHAEALHPDKIFILSGKYHLLRLDDLIEPYDVNLNLVSEDELIIWSETVLRQLSEEVDLKDDHFVFLASDRYCKYLIKHIRNYEIPFEVE